MQVFSIILFSRNLFQIILPIDLFSSRSITNTESSFAEMAMYFRDSLKPTDRMGKLLTTNTQNKTFLIAHTSKLLSTPSHLRALKPLKIICTHEYFFKPWLDILIYKKPMILVICAKSGHMLKHNLYNYSLRFWC